ncbi:B-cell lymphoma 3 protein-like [Montipora foliosa]|uniref:B-cell lymphoma 3 protein-like n=1 Tax=Montipora foliosa TaxID=591990 RepID=UPI0035F14094
MELTTVDFVSHGLNLTSALGTNFADSVQRTTKDAIKRKLTARVSPRTRQTDEIYNPRVDSKKSYSHHPNSDCNVKKEHVGHSNCSAMTSSSRNLRVHKKLAEKRKSPATSVMIPQNSEKSNSSHLTREDPPSKRLRTILPRTSTTTSSAQGITQDQAVTPKTPMSPEPKLLSLLSASECHLAALQDEDGDTPLHIAIAHGNSQLTEYLIDLMQCMTLDIYNNLKQTPLHLAVITGQAQIVGKLVSAGANGNMPDRNGHTPCHLACQRSYVDCLKKLVMVTNGVDLELKNYSGFTPLHEAVIAQCTRSVRCLVEHGANPNSKDGKSGRTPLHHAVETENTNVIAELLRWGANPGEPAFSGNTPIQIASGRGMQSIRQQLENSSKGTVLEYKQVCSKQHQPVMVPFSYEDNKHMIFKSTYA